MASLKDYGESIEIDFLQIEECSGNLKKLLNQWEEKRCKLSKQLGNIVSQGFMADGIFRNPKKSKGVVQAIDEISDSTTRLLENSIEFFKILGVVFKDLDNQTARALKE